MRPTQNRYRSGLPTLYYDELSPQCRSCYMLVKLLDIDVKLQPPNLIRDEQLSESYRNVSDNIICFIIGYQSVIFVNSRLVLLAQYPP